MDFLAQQVSTASLCEAKTENLPRDRRRAANSALPSGRISVCLFLDEAISCKTRRVGSAAWSCLSGIWQPQSGSALAIRKTTIGVTFQSRHGTQQLSCELSSNGSKFKMGPFSLLISTVGFHCSGMLFPLWNSLKQTPEPPKTTSKMGEIPIFGLTVAWIWVEGDTQYFHPSI